MGSIKLTQHALALPADVQTPISLYLGLVGERPGILLESAEIDGRLGRYSLIAYDFKLTLSCREGRLRVATADPRFEAVKRLDGAPFLEGLHQCVEDIDILPPEDFPDMPAITRSLVGYFGYGAAALFEPKIAPLIPAKSIEATMVLPAKVAVFDHLKHKLYLLSLEKMRPPRIDATAIHASPERPVVGQIREEPGREAFERSVSLAKEEIRRGECIQVVLSSRFSAPFSGSPFVLYRRLRQINPSPYMFHMRLPRVTLVGSSPELLVRSQGGKLTTCPIAGTRVRGANEAQDRANAESLLADPKERAEHVMLVDLGRNDLGRVSEPGSVVVEKFMQVERFSHVMHLTSYVTSTLKKGLGALDALGSCFPAGTLSGAPKVRAMELIAGFEGAPRGPYGGAVAWLGLTPGSTDMDTGILIRTMWVRDGMISWQTGAGIVYDSDPHMEWQECHNKARVIFEVLKGSEDGDVLAH